MPPPPASPAPPQGERITSPTLPLRGRWRGAPEGVRSLTEGAASHAGTAVSSGTLVASISTSSWAVQPFSMRVRAVCSGAIGMVPTLLNR